MKSSFIYLLAVTFLLLTFNFTQATVSADGLSAFAIAQPQPTPKAGKPTFTEYRGISIGMSTDVVRGKLEKPEEQSPTGDYFVFSRKESAQIMYDAAKNVKAISINYLGDLDEAPSTIAVLGIDVPKDAEGGINKRIQFPDSGYWASYIRTAGDDPMIIITLQKMVN